MNELKLIEPIGQISSNFEILNEDEYAFILGSLIVVKQFKSSVEEKETKILKSESTGFSTIAYNRYHNLFCAVESGKNTAIKLFYYHKQEGFDLQSAYTVKNSLKCQDISISSKADALACLYNEPLFSIIIFSISVSNEGRTLRMKEILSINITESFDRIAFDPMRSEHIFLFSKTLLSVVEVIDAFPKDYKTSFSRLNPEELSLQPKFVEFINTSDLPTRSKEESEVFHRHIIREKRLDDGFEFVDFCWDTNSCIYVAVSNREIFLYDINFDRMSSMYKDELRESVLLNDEPLALLMTQRYLLCITVGKRLNLINIYIPLSELGLYRSSLGVEEKYQTYSIDRTYDVIDLGNVALMKYDYNWKNIVLITKEGSMQIISLEAECLIKDKEKDEYIDSVINMNLESNNIGDLESITEGNFHNYEIEDTENSNNWLNRVIGIREIPGTSNIITIADDQKIIIWDLADRSSKLVDYLYSYRPTCFEIDKKGNLLIVGSSAGVIRIYDITQKHTIRLIFQAKYLSNPEFMAIDRIIVHPEMKFIGFCNLSDQVIYFISGETKNEFKFLGYLRVNYEILDIDLIMNPSGDELIVLVKKLLLSYQINYNKFIIDHRDAIKIKGRKDFNIYDNFQIYFELMARKIDSDLNLIVKNKDEPNIKKDSVWLVGKDLYFRQYKIPSDQYDKVKDNRKPPDRPADECISHDLEVTDALCFRDFIVSGASDGSIHIRQKKQIISHYRTHNFLLGGISTVSYSSERSLLYVGGFDGSFFILALDESYIVPKETIIRDIINDDLEASDTIDILDDDEVRSQEDLINEEYERIIKIAKKNFQIALKERLDKIKTELNKYIIENSRQEEIEQLSSEQMVIDPDQIAQHRLNGEKQENDLNKLFFYELCKKEIYCKKLYEKTFNVSTVKDQQGKMTNNNIRIFSNMKGDKFLKSFPIRTFNAYELACIRHAKELRMIELQEKYKRRQQSIPEVIDEKQFTNLDEKYLVNRISAQIELKETAIKPEDIFGHDPSIKGEDKAGFKAAKYRLQRDPYESLGLKARQDDNQENVKYNPEEQLLKEDLSVKYITKVAPVEDVDVKTKLEDVDMFSLIYSPFELYTTFRMRTQIYLLMDIIQQLKMTFNEDLRKFIAEKNALLEKYNSNKILIDALKEALGSENIQVSEYNIIQNPHEDNEWVNKFRDAEVTVPKYFSREERQRMEEEKRLEEERLKSLQGDKLEKRGLNAMIAEQVIKSKNENQDEPELKREEWMDTKDQNKWTEEELKKHNEYLRKEKEILDRKEKIRSQNLTKLNNLKMDMETLTSEIELKFLKIMKKKLYYDYRITEQEMYILSMMRIQEYRHSIRLKKVELEQKLEEAKGNKEEYEKLKNEFEVYKEIFDSRLQVLENKFNDKQKANRENYINQILSEIELTQEDKDYLKQIRYDPNYFDMKKKLKESKKYGNNKYEEITKNNTANEVLIKNTQNYVSFALLSTITRKKNSRII